MEENQVQQDLASIRSLMERSSKFISLSGLSGILAGIYALIGSGAAYCILYNTGSVSSPSRYNALSIYNSVELVQLMGLSLVVLVASIATGVLLSVKKARKNRVSIWGPSSRALLFNMMVPLLTGGILILILLLRGYLGIIAPTTLIFYGLSLIGASNNTFYDVKYLGFSEIILGLIAALFPGWGLLFWAIGFGVLHIVYGSIMYIKYDR